MIHVFCSFDVVSFCVRRQKGEEELLFSIPQKEKAKIPERPAVSAMDSFYKIAELANSKK